MVLPLFAFAKFSVVGVFTGLIEDSTTLTKCSVAMHFGPGPGPPKRTCCHRLTQTPSKDPLFGPPDRTCCLRLTRTSPFGPGPGPPDRTCCHRLTQTRVRNRISAPLIGHAVFGLPGHRPFRTPSCWPGVSRWEQSPIFCDISVMSTKHVIL